MKSRFLLVGVVAIVAVFGCQKSVKRQDLKFLNGYWEIQSVKMGDGEEKTYKVNEVIDFFELNDLVGIRKKVMPQFDGRYLVNDTFEAFLIKDSAGVFMAVYQSKYDSRRETIIELDSTNLVLKGANGSIYQYKRPVPFSLK